MPAPSDHKTILYQAKFGNVCAGFEVSKGRVVRAAPILGRFIGQQFSDIRNWVVYRKDGIVDSVREEADAITEYD